MQQQIFFGCNYLESRIRNDGPIRQSVPVSLVNMSLDCLLEAARIVEQRECSGNRIISSTVLRRDKKLIKRSHTYRSTHNQLEKNRRAHLRDCLVSLRDLVPSPPDVSKVTTLSLLQSAKQYIKVLENHDREAQSLKRNLCLEQQQLRKKLSLLMNGYANSDEPVVIFKSESSTSSVNSSCDEEIDVENDFDTGYASADDRSSTGSLSSLTSVL